MILSIALQQLFPNADPMRDYIVQDDSDGNGPYIAQWNLPDKQPSEAELLAAWEAKPPEKVEVELPNIEVIDQMTELSEIREVVKLLVEKLQS